MIIIQNAKRRNSNEWCRCCSSDIETKRIFLCNSDNSNQRTSFVLCKNCCSILITMLEEQLEEEQESDTE